MARRLFVSAVPFALICALAAPARASNCANTSIGKVPLTDLGTGLYQGFQGGLYAGGSNHRPDAHNAAGLVIANAMAPLDTSGNPDPVSGRIVLISIGMSNCTQEFSAFVPKARTDPLRNPSVFVIDCAEGGQAANVINNVNAAYWDTVASRLRGHGSSPLQAQIAWVKEADRQPTGGFPASAETLEAHMRTVILIAKQVLPNLKLVYFTSRVYAGYATTTLNPDPYAYESGFSVKWLIDAQIQGDPGLNYNPANGAVMAPWMAWGPYLWTDGMNPRIDGLVWPCDYLNSTDGTHPSSIGRDVISDSLLAFFHADETTAPWYLASGVGVPVPNPTAAVEFAAFPNPARGDVAFRFVAAAGEPWTLDVVDVTGRRVCIVAQGVGRGVAEERRWSARGATGARAHAGLYWARLRVGERTAVRRVALVQAQ